MKPTLTLYYLTIYKGNLTDQEVLERFVEYGDLYPMTRPYQIFTDTHVYIYDLDDVEDRADLVLHHGDLGLSIVRAYKEELAGNDDYDDIGD
jgi:hypothetical protein